MAAITVLARHAYRHTPLITGSAVEGGGTTAPVYTVFNAKDQGAFDLTVMPDGSGKLKIERWDSDEVRQTAVESQVSIRHRAVELHRPIRLRLSLAAC